MAHGLIQMLWTFLCPHSGAFVKALKEQMGLTDQLASTLNAVARPKVDFVLVHVESKVVDVENCLTPTGCFAVVCLQNDMKYHEITMGIHLYMHKNTIFL